MNKHIATFAGVTFARNSKTRRYSHCVIGRPSLEHARKQACSKGHDKFDRSNWKWYSTDRAYVDWNGSTRPCKVHGVTYEDAESFLMDYPSVQDWMESEFERRLSSVDAKAAAGYFAEYYLESWHTRRDLAARKVAKLSSMGYYADVIMLEATINE